MKTCKRCQLSKPLTDFHPDPRGADGYVARCRRCVSLGVSEYRRDHPESVERDLAQRKEVNDSSREAATRHQQYWDTYQVALLKEFWASENVTDLAEALGRTVESVRSKAHTLGLRKRSSEQ